MDTKYDKLKEQIRTDVQEIFSNTEVKIKKPKMWMAIVGFLLLILSPGVGAILSLILKQDSLFGTPSIITIVIFLIAAFIFLGIYGTQWTKLKKVLSELIPMERYYQAYIQATVGDEVKECHYSHNKYEVNALMDEYRNLDFEFNQSSNSGFLDFEINGAKIHFGRVTFVKVVKKEKGSSTETVVQTYFEMHNPVDFASTDLNFYFKSWKFHVDKGMEKVSLESDEFNKLVKLYALDQIQVRKTFPPIVMANTIDHLENKQQGKLEFLFLKGKTAFGQVKPFNAKTQIGKTLVDFKYNSNFDKMAENIFAKVQSEAHDICDVIKFIKIIQNNK